MLQMQMILFYSILFYLLILYNIIMSSSYPRNNQFVNTTKIQSIIRKVRTIDEDNLTTEHDAVDEDDVTNEDYFTIQDYVTNYN